MVFVEIKNIKDVAKVEALKSIKTIEKPVFIFAPDTVEIPKGGSFCGTLDMTKEKALDLAEKFNYPIRYNSQGELIVIVQPGEIFIKNAWQPAVLKHMVAKK